MIKKILCGVLMLFMLFMLSVTTYCQEISITSDAESRCVTIEGEIEYGNVPVYIQLLYPKMKLDNISSAENYLDVVAFAEVTQSDENGKFSSKAELNGESGFYSAYISYDGYLGDYPYGTVYFINKDEQVALFEKISHAETTKEEIQGILEDKWPVLGLETELYKKIPTNVAAKYVYNLRASLTARKAVGTAYTLLGLNKGIVSDIEDCFEILQIPTDDGIGKWYADKTSNEFRSFVMKRLNGRDYDNYENFISEFKEVVILGVIKYPDGSNQIKNILTEFKDEVGISSINSNNNVYLALAGNQYNSLSEVKAAYEKAVKDNKTSGSSGGSGGGGSGGGGSGRKSSAATVTDARFENDSGIKSIVPYEEEAIFTDIENVGWAKESIEYLYNKGIVVGKGDKIFAPYDAITREEFTKLIVAAFNIKSEGEDLSFIDVTDDKWFYEYIKTAYNAGIVKGIGDTFGVGEDISRQDMAVIIYNTLKHCGYEFENMEMTETFTDMDQCADYAKNAVMALKNSKIINGYDNNSFGPLNKNTRAEAAKVIHSVILLLK